MATFPMGAGQGLLLCPGGAGLGQGLHARAGAETAVAAKGSAVGLPAALGPQGHGLAGVGAGKGMGMGLGSAVAGAGKGTAVSGAAGAGKAVAACSATGKGLSLGLGIGLGLWGPAILAGLGVAAAYTLWRSRAAVEALSDEDTEMGEALAERNKVEPGTRGKML